MAKHWHFGLGFSVGCLLTALGAYYLLEDEVAHWQYELVTLQAQQAEERTLWLTVCGERVAHD